MLVDKGILKFEIFKIVITHRKVYLFSSILNMLNSNGKN